MKKYLVIGASVGLMQVIDAGILYAHNGVCEGISVALSIPEFLWAIVSIIVVFRVKHLPTRCAAIVFFAYNLIGWILSYSIETTDTTLIIPIWAVLTGGIFGLVYCIYCAYAASKP
jgi:hypothetical protein